LALLLVVPLSGGLWLRHQVLASVARYDGVTVLDALAGNVTVQRDGLGVPMIRGGGFEDVVRATGFVHAQERYFQMDVMRRQAAGELAALLGASAVGADRAARVHRLRLGARAAVEALAPDRRALLEAYAAGVNAGLRDLGNVPPEYLLLRTDPDPWLPEDSFLTLFAMYLRLQDATGRLDATLGTLFDVLPRNLAEFLAPRGTPWEAPIDGEPFEMPPTPGPEILDLRAQPGQIPSRGRFSDPDAPLLGSNSWSVAGVHTADGGALLANDMHLPLGMPNIWYRLSQIWIEGGRERRVTGVSLAGIPVVLAGSTGRVAWGFTNSQGDWTDLVILTVDPSDHSRYLTPDGARSFVESRETIEIKDAQPQELTVRDTIWGPVVDSDRFGRPRAAHWVAHLPGAVNLEILDLLEAETVDQAIEVAHRAGVPAQNFVVVDKDGRIGWTIIGPVPRRVGTDGRLPASWAAGTTAWDGWLAGDKVPRVVDPPAGRIWTANARVVSGKMLEALGDGGYDLGARARQIRNALMAIDKATPQRMLDVQLDDRALFLTPWRELMLQVLSRYRLSRGPRIEELVRWIERDWTGRASVDSVAYRMVRDWRSHVARRALLPLVAASAKADPAFDYFLIGGRIEGPLWRLVTERPPHLLQPRYGSWDELFLDAADGLLEELVGDDPDPSLAGFTWGARNSFAVRHPLSRAVPIFSRWLDIPARPLPGDSNMPRVYGIGVGASERFVVSPGREEQGIFEMPAGQSGHPWSAYYRAGHDLWAEGRPAAFLPGPTVHTLTLVPAR
jgi:penicillin amidase